MVEVVVAVVAEVGAMVVVGVMVGSDLVVTATLGEHAVAGAAQIEHGLSSRQPQPEIEQSLGVMGKVWAAAI
jgi:hypothetical protein